MAPDLRPGFERAISRLSPTTTQILEVPISDRPSDLLSPFFIRLSLLGYDELCGTGAEAARDFKALRIQFLVCRNPGDSLSCARTGLLSYPWLDSGLQCVVDYCRRRIGKRHGMLRCATRFKVSSSCLVFITVIKEHLQPPQLPFEIVQTKHDATAILVGHEETIIFGDIDFANLKARLQKSCSRETQQIERCFCFERFDSFPASSDSLEHPTISGSPRYSQQFFFVSFKTPRAPTKNAASEQMDH